MIDSNAEVITFFSEVILSSQSHVLTRDKSVIPIFGDNKSERRLNDDHCLKYRPKSRRERYTKPPQKNSSSSDNVSASTNYFKESNDICSFVKTIINQKHE